MRFTSKVELKKHLEEMGIKMVKGDYVLKKDIDYVLSGTSSMSADDTDNMHMDQGKGWELRFGSHKKKFPYLNDLFHYAAGFIEVDDDEQIIYLSFFNYDDD